MNIFVVLIPVIAMFDKMIERPDICYDDLIIIVILILVIAMFDIMKGQACWIM